MTTEQEVISRKILTERVALNCLIGDKDEKRFHNPWYPVQKINAKIGASKRKITKLGNELKIAGVKRVLL